MKLFLKTPYPGPGGPAASKGTVPGEEWAELICRDGFRLVLGSTGAGIRRIQTPEPDGRMRDLVLCLARQDLYTANSLYAGATLAPTAGRIAGGRLPVGDKEYRLTCNENGINCLHGGAQNASFRRWQTLETLVEEERATVLYALELPEGLDGFPGNRQLRVRYSLTEDRRLTVRYEAVSDRETYFNLSGHTYFDLSGSFQGLACRQQIRIRSGRFIANRPDFIPEEVLPVEGTPFDFRRPISPAEQKAAFPGDRQLDLNRGCNHGFFLERDPQDPGPDPGPCSLSREPDLTVVSPDGLVTMEVRSDAPCMVFYSGGYIEEGLPLLCSGPAAGSEDRILSSVPESAFAFEFQDPPDAPGGHGFPYRTSPAGSLWTRTVCYHFS